MTAKQSAAAGRELYPGARSIRADPGSYSAGKTRNRSYSQRPATKLTNSMRGRLHEALRRYLRNYNVKCISVVRDLGCSMPEFVVHKRDTAGVGATP